MGHLRPPDPPGAPGHGRQRRPLRAGRPASVAAAPRQRRPRPQLARRQPGRDPGPLPGRRETPVRLLRRSPGGRLRRPLRSRGPRLLGPDEPARRRGPPHRLLPAGDRDLSRHLRDRSLQDLLGAGRRDRAPDRARRRERAGLRPAPGVRGRVVVAGLRRPGRGRDRGPRRPRRRRRGHGNPGAGSRRRVGRQHSGPANTAAERCGVHRSSKGKRFPWSSREPGLPDPGGSSRPPDPLDACVTASGC